MTRTFEHFIWLHPSFFCMGDLQLGQGLELVTNHRQLAATSVSSSVPDTVFGGKKYIVKSVTLSLPVRFWDRHDIVYKKAKVVY